MFTVQGRIHGVLTNCRVGPVKCSFHWLDLYEKQVCNRPSAFCVGFIVAQAACAGAYNKHL